MARCTHEWQCGQTRLDRTTGVVRRFIVCDQEAGGCGETIRELAPAPERSALIVALNAQGAKAA